MVGVYKQFNQKLRSYSIYSTHSNQFSWRYFSPSLALIEWVCKPSNRTPVAVCIITTHKPHIKLFLLVFLLLCVKQKTTRNFRWLEVHNNCQELRLLFNIFKVPPTGGWSFFRPCGRLTTGCESQQQNTCCGIYYKCCFLILQSYFSLV